MSGVTASSALLRSGARSPRSRVTALAAASWFFASVGLAGGAEAQHRPPAPVPSTVADADPLEVDAAARDARAHALFVRGVHALRAGQAAEGRDLLRESVTLAPRVSNRFNLAVALRRTGQTVEAIAMLQALLADPEILVEDRLRASQQLGLAREEIGRLVVRITGAPSAVIEVDGVPAGRAAVGAPAVVDVDGGEHRVIARSGTTARLTIHVERGGTREITLRVEPPRDPDAREDLTWLWLTLGLGGAVTVGLAITFSVLLAPPQVLAPEPDPVTGLYMTLRERPLVRW